MIADNYYKSKKRFWEIDLLRGFAIILMVVFNATWAFDFFGVVSINLKTLFWQGFSIFIGSLFIVLVGVSLTLSYSKLKQKDKFHTKYLSRGLTIFAYGMIVSLASFILLKEGTVVFGVLHLIGIGIMAASLFLRAEFLNLIIGFTIIIVGTFFGELTITNKYLVWLGLKFPGFFTIDYFPLFPWLGVIFIGLFIGNVFYKDGKRLIKVTHHPKKWLKPLLFMGRHSLMIYFGHAIAILTIIFIIKLVV